MYRHGYPINSRHLSYHLAYMSFLFTGVGMHTIIARQMNIENSPYDPIFQVCRADM